MKPPKGRKWPASRDRIKQQDKKAQLKAAHDERLAARFEYLANSEQFPIVREQLPNGD